jgi:hypothetical protein
MAEPLLSRDKCEFHFAVIPQIFALAQGIDSGSSNKPRFAKDGRSRGIGAGNAVSNNANQVFA